MHKNKLVLLATGGTGGHMFPAQALATKLIADGYKIALCTNRIGDSLGGVLANTSVHRISAAGVAGHGPFGRLKGFLALGIGVFQAYRLLHQLKPSVVVGFGGYAAAPTTYAAIRARIPLIIHEQNAVLGRANRFVANHAKRLCLSFDETRLLPSEAACTKTGMPIRSVFSEVGRHEYKPPTSDGPIRLLVLGGSQGAAVFSKIVPEAISAVPTLLRERLEITQQCRPELLDETQAKYSQLGISSHLDTFFENVSQLMGLAHLVISRAGASSVAEVTAASRPSLLVPYPFAADDHQSANAKALENSGGGWHLSETNFTSEKLTDFLSSVLASPEQLEKVAKKAKAFSLPDAAIRLANVVVQAIERSHGGDLLEKGAT